MMEQLNQVWTAWRALFADIPGGDPYLAVAALMVLVAVAARLTVGRTDD